MSPRALLFLLIGGKYIRRLVYRHTSDLAIPPFSPAASVLPFPAGSAAWVSTPPLFQNGGCEPPPPLHVGKAVWRGPAVPARPPRASRPATCPRGILVGCEGPWVAARDVGSFMKAGRAVRSSREPSSAPTFCIRADGGGGGGDGSGESLFPGCPPLETNLTSSPVSELGILDS